MKKILHISTECYPAAKAGGMGDVVGALPLYMPKHGYQASVIIPKYDNRWFADQKFTTVKRGEFLLGEETINFRIQKLKKGLLDYPFYCVDIPGKFDRENIYLSDDGHGYSDEVERNLSFQIAILTWLTTGRQQFDGLHCHDHMTGLTIFMVKYCPDFQKLKDKPTFFTIHNGQYRGVLNWSIQHLLPKYDRKYDGMLDWDGQINCLASAIKCAWVVNTVSPSYMRELERDSDTLTDLYKSERPKCTGVINGIDNELWNPATDTYLKHHLENQNWSKFKKENKQVLQKKYELKGKGPLLGFIGRFAEQKGADLLAKALEKQLQKNKNFDIIILGSGDKSIEQDMISLSKKYPSNIAAIIAYDEALSRNIYAGTDFLMMPSKFEPCGLNQMYAMRYGSVPIVTHVGGLKDTVPDVKDDGNGIVSKDVSAVGFSKAIGRALKLYAQNDKYEDLRDKLVELDYSWSKSAEDYKNLYNRYIN